MTVTLRLKPDIEARARAEADARGVPIEEFLQTIVDKSVPATESQRDTTLELFAQWDAEDATDDPAEIERRESEWEELKANLNANRAVNGERLLFP